MHNNKPSALLLTSSHCPHCHSLETLLKQRLKNGKLAALDVINIEKSPDIATQYNVRSVPWLRLGELEFGSTLTSSELDGWLMEYAGENFLASYLGHLLSNGQLVDAIKWIEQGKAGLIDLLPLLSDPDVKMNVRIGIGALMETFEGDKQFKMIFDPLVELCRHENPVVRIDACHYLSLTQQVEALDILQAMLNDDHEHVREIAAEGIEELKANAD